MTAFGSTIGRTHAVSFALALGALLLATGLLACHSSDADLSPSDALSHFLEAMDRSSVNDEALADAYALLDDAGQRALSQRAEQAALVAGHEFPPWQMLAQGRFRLRFTPADHGGMRAEVHGSDAVVRVLGDDGRSQAAVPMVKQAGRWRVKLDVSATAVKHDRAEP